jgi:hypothetical protein
MLSAFTPTSSSVTMLSLTLTGCLANLIGHAEAAEQDRGGAGKSVGSVCSHSAVCRRGAVRRPLRSRQAPVLKLSTLSSASGGMETAGLVWLTAKKV